MKLASYLSTKGITRSDFAALIGMSQSYVTMLCQGRIWPSREVVAKITEATAGEITANDFVEPPVTALPANGAAA